MNVPTTETTPSERARKITSKDPADEVGVDEESATRVGAGDKVTVGAAVGLAGSRVGGVTVGAIVGDLLGILVGAAEGLEDGAGEIVGAGDGPSAI